jgi:hypothetical protein
MTIDTLPKQISPLSLASYLHHPLWRVSDVDAFSQFHQLPYQESGRHNYHQDIFLKFHYNIISCYI